MTINVYTYTAYKSESEYLEFLSQFKDFFKCDSDNIEMSVNEYERIKNSIHVDLMARLNVYEYKKGLINSPEYSHTIILSLRYDDSHLSGLFNLYSASIKDKKTLSRVTLSHIDRNVMFTDNVKIKVLDKFIEMIENGDCATIKIKDLYFYGKKV